MSRDRKKATEEGVTGWSRSQKFQPWLRYKLHRKRETLLSSANTRRTCSRDRRTLGNSTLELRPFNVPTACMYLATYGNLHILGVRETLDDPWNFDSSSKNKSTIVYWNRVVMASLKIWINSFRKIWGISKFQNYKSSIFQNSNIKKFWDSKILRFQKIRIPELPIVKGSVIFRFYIIFETPYICTCIRRKYLKVWIITFNIVTY